MTNNLEKENNDNKEISNKTYDISVTDLYNQILEINKKITNFEIQLETNTQKLSTTEENFSNSFLKISGGQLFGSLKLNKNSISDLVTPEQADPFFAANVGYVLNQMSKVLKQIDNISLINSSHNTEINNIKTTLDNYESQFEALSHRVILAVNKEQNDPSTTMSIDKDVNMQSHSISGLVTPKSKNLDFAANVAFVKACIDPLSGQFSALTQQVESNTKALCNIQLNFLPTTGGFLYGSLNMQNNKITGLRAPTTPSDAVSLDYLNQVLTNSEHPINVSSSAKNNLLYSTYPNYHVSMPLPLPLIKSGYNGWTWHLSASYSEGYYDWTNLSFEQTNPDSKSFEFSLKNPNELLLKQTGEYIFSFSLVALIPANINQCYPSIQLNINEDFSTWGQKNQKFSPSSSKPLTLISKESVNILGVLYDIVELSSLSSQINPRIIITPKQKYCSISLQNINFKCNESSSLYVVQNHVSISWMPF